MNIALFSWSLNARSSSSAVACTGDFLRKPCLLNSVWSAESPCPVLFPLQNPYSCSPCGRSNDWKASWCAPSSVLLLSSGSGKGGCFWRLRVIISSLALRRCPPFFGGALKHSDKFVKVERLIPLLDAAQGVGPSSRKSGEPSLRGMCAAGAGVPATPLPPIVLALLCEKCEGVSKGLPLREGRMILLEPLDWAKSSSLVRRKERSLSGLFERSSFGLSSCRIKSGCVLGEIFRGIRWVF